MYISMDKEGVQDKRRQFSINNIYIYRYRILILWTSINLPMGPIPGPPPPWGIQKVLCKFKWQTSAPMAPGLHNPTCEFILAPSI